MSFTRFVRALACAAAILFVSSAGAAPEPPANLRPAWVDGSSAVLIWEDNPQADSYNVYRYDTMAQNWALAGSNLLAPMFREAPGQEPPLQYAVTAVNAEGESAAAAISVDQGGWPDFMVMFYDPSWYPWLVSRTSVTLQIAASPVSGVDALLEFGDDPSQLEFLEYRPSYEGFHTFTVTDLSPGTQYFYRLTLSGANRLGLSLQNSFYTPPENQVPQVSPISVEIWEDSGAPYIVPNGSDVDGPMPLTTRIVTQPAGGAVLFDGYYMIYQPEPNFFGTVSFTYAMHDGEDESAPATVTITIHPVNDPGVNQTPTVELSILEDASASGSIVVTDVENDAHSLELWSWPEAGAVEVSGTSFVYSPAPNYHGIVQFHLAARDSTGVSAEGVTVVTVAIAPVNDDPAASSAEAFLDEDTELPLTLSGSDADGDSLEYAIEQQPAHGTLSGEAPNVIYTPAPNYHGSDSFSFTVSDGQAQSASAQVSITVSPVNDAPTAAPYSTTVAEDGSVAIVLAGSDPDGDAVTFVIVQAPSNGALSGSAPNLIYAPNANYNGPDGFLFAVSDGQAQSASAQVSIAISAVNDAPIAVPQSVITPYNTAVSITLGGTDVDGNPLSFSIVTNPANGTLSGAAPNLVFTPNIGWSGATSFTFRADDGQASSAPATVTITVQNTTTVPAAPNGLTAQAVSRTQINLAWNDNSNNEDGFKIERSTGSGYTQIATVGPNVRAFSSTGLSANKSYSYRVRAFNVRGNSAYSNVASARTLR